MNKNESFDLVEAGRWPVSETLLARSEKGGFEEQSIAANEGSQVGEKKREMEKAEGNGSKLMASRPGFRFKARVGESCRL